MTPAYLSGFTEIIDARTPSEYAEDRIPGAINLPVLDDAERVRIGTMHKQLSAFEAKKAGAALVSRHIADYLERHFADKPANYKPLVYCWRGGNRSGSLAHVLQRVGFHAEQLNGGYKAYRRMVLAELEELPRQFGYIVICGPTGCGKSRLLQSLAKAGAQVLDLEDLARHRGSLLGSLPGEPQPSQKGLESAIWWQLKQMNPTRPVFVESESKKIGNLQVPDALLTSMRAGKRIWLKAHMDLRVRLLLEEYDHFLAHPDVLRERIGHLVELRGAETIQRWTGLIDSGAWALFVRDMLQKHYDPAYEKSLSRNYKDDEHSMNIGEYELSGIDSNSFDELSRTLLAGNPETNC